MDWFELTYRISLIGTFFALIWYAYETRKIRQINLEQKDLQQMPAMMIYIRRHSGSERPFVRNIGFGTAVGVDVLKSTVENGKWEFTYHLVDNNNTLISKEERLIGINLKIDGQEHSDPLPNWLAYYDPTKLQRVKERRQGDTANSVTPIRKNLRVRFKDITGQKYETKIRFSDSGVTVASPPRRV